MQKNQAEAERRIEKAWRDRAEILDLGGFALGELPTSLSRLGNLKNLDLSRTGITDLSPLSHLRGLQSLLGTSFPYLPLLSGLLKDSSPLSHLHRLQILQLSRTGVKDLSLLSGLRDLQRLYLLDTGVTDVSPLSGLRRLQRLDLMGTGVTDLSPLSGLRGLQRLYLGRGVTDLSPLSGLRGLQRLDLMGTDETDLSPLSNLQDLHSLHLPSSVTDLSPLSNLRGLRRLYLGWGVPDLSPLSGLHGLRMLELWGTGVTDFSPLIGLRNLIIIGGDPEARAKFDRGRNPEKAPKVFISYAWGDDTSEGKVRSQTVEALHAALEKGGFQPARDRDQILPGEPISAFISRLTRADLIVVVISDKYLRSYYCMYEIYKLWQRCQGDHEELIQHVVPIILPEVRIKDFEERMLYIKYWSDRAKQLKALVLDPELNPSPESWHEVRSIQEFAYHLDGILVFLQDVLMPRNLEAHLDDGFQAVREALRRRIEK